MTNQSNNLDQNSNQGDQNQSGGQSNQGDQNQSGGKAAHKQDTTHEYDSKKVREAGGQSHKNDNKD